MNNSRITDLPTPKSPPKRGLSNLNIAIITLTEEGLKTARRMGTGFNPPPSTYVFKKIGEGNNCIIEDEMSPHMILFSEPLHQLVNYYGHGDCRKGDCPKHSG